MAPGEAKRDVAATPPAVHGSVLYGALAAGSAWSELPTPQTTYDFGTLGVLVAFLPGSLPASVAAWTEPDPDLDE